MATIQLDGDETVLYGPGFQTTVLSPGLGSTQRPIAVVTDPATGDGLVYQNGAFVNRPLVVSDLDDLTASVTELNTLDGITASVTELNTLDGITASVTELNYTDGVTSAIQTQLDGKVDLTGDTMTGALVIDASSGDTLLRLDANASQRATQRFSAAGTTKWDIILETDNTLVFQRAGVANPLVIGTTDTVTVDKALVVNESGGNNDTRVEGDTDVNLLFADASTDRVGIGTSSPSAKLHLQEPSGNAIRVDAGSANLIGDVRRFNNDAIGTRIWTHKSRHATIGSHTIVQNDDELVAIVGLGSDGTEFELAAQIGLYVDGSPATNDMPGRISFFTTPDGSASLSERVRIGNAGGISIQDGITAPPTIAGFATLYVDTADGDLKVKFGDGTVKTIVVDT